MTSMVWRRNVVERAPPTSQWVGYLVVAAAVGLFLADLGRNVPQIDDAYISYRYAANLVAGHGLVFNMGEYVEGMTNLLWTLLVAGLMTVGMDGPQAGLMLSGLFGSLCLVGTFRLVLVLAGAGAVFAAAAAPVVLLSLNAFAAWTTGGLETPLFAFLVLLAALFEIEGRRWATAVICMIATLTRPEGVLLALCLVGSGCLAGWRRTTDRWKAAGTLGPALAYGSFLLALTACRYWYYGDIVPNTFHAKVGGNASYMGLRYAENALSDGPWLLLPGSIVSAVLLPRMRSALLFCVVIMLYVIAVGGDVFVDGRFLLPCFPLLACSSLAAAGVLWKSHRLSAGMLASITMLTCLWSLYSVWPGKRLLIGDAPATATDLAAGFSDEFPFSAKRILAERHYWLFDEDPIVKHMLAKFAILHPGSSLIATIGIGRTGYFAPQDRILDLVGLVDRHIALSDRKLDHTARLQGHSRTDAPYVMAQQPDFIVIPPKGTTLPLVFPAVLDLWQQADLERAYYYDAEIGAYVRRRSVGR